MTTATTGFTLRYLLKALLPYQINGANTPPEQLKFSDAGPRKGMIPAE